MKKGVDFTGVAVVFACHDGQGNFLFAKRGKSVRDGAGLWEIPAGGVKFGETIHDALRREVKEELGAPLESVEFITYKDVIEREGDKIIKHWVVFEFLIKVNPLEVQIMEPEMCEVIEWHTLDTYPEPLHFGVKETIENVRAFLKQKENI